MTAFPLAEMANFFAGAGVLVFLIHRWRPQLRLATGAAYAALALAFLAPILLAPRHLVATDLPYRWRPWLGETAAPVVAQNRLLSDPPLQLYPMWRLAREHLVAGHPPLWAHQLSTGEPLAGLAQAAPFAPLRLLTLALPPLSGLDVAAALQLLLALLLMHALAARLGASPLASGFAAIAFAFSSYAIAWLAYPLGTAPMWLPGVVLGLLGVHRGERGGIPGLTVCAWGLAASGHPETVGHAALVCGLVATVLIRRAEPGHGGRAGFLRRLATATGLTACLAAPVLLPVIEALPDSQRWNQMRFAPDSVDPAPFSLATLSLLIDPLRLGSVRDDDYTGPVNWNEDATGYAGLLTLALALAGGAGRRRWPVLLGGLAALGVALAVPPLLAAMKMLPVLGIGAHGRLRWLWIFALALCAAWGIDAATADRRRWAIAGVTAAIAGLALLPPRLPAPGRLGWYAAVLLGALAVLATLLLPRLRPAFPAAALIALLADLGALGWRYNARVEDALSLAPPASLASLISLGERAPEERGRRVIAEGEDLYPNLAYLYGLWDPRPNDPMVSWAVKAFLDRALPRAYRVHGRVRPVREDPQPVFDYLGVGTRLTRGRRELPAPWRLAARWPGLKLWQNRNVLPLFQIPRQVREVENQARALQAAVRLLDYAASAVVEGSSGVERSRTGGRGTIKLARIDPNGFRLSFIDGPLDHAAERASQPSATPSVVAISSVTFARGWRALADGRRTPTLRANGAFLAFELPAGADHVDLRFLPASWLFGCLLAALGLTACLAGLRPPRPRYNPPRT